MKKATTRQIKEIVTQLVDGGIGHDEADRIIQHRTPAEVAAARDLREVQARVLFEKIGDAIGCETLEQYLNGTDAIEGIPQVPVFPKEQVRLFGTDGVMLRDGRAVKRVGLREYCKLVGLAYSGQDATFEPWKSEQTAPDLCWLIGQDGFRNRSRKPSDCRETFAPFEIGADVVDGIAIWLQESTVINGHYLDLPGSVRRDNRGRVAYLGVIDSQPELSWRWNEGAHPECGPASRGVLKRSPL